MSTRQAGPRGGSKHGRIRMEARLTIYEAAAEKERLLAKLDHVNRLEIDLSSVLEMDTAGVQLLVLLKRAATEAGKSMSLVAHSTASVETLDCLGLTRYFGDPVVLASGREARRSRR